MTEFEIIMTEFEKLSILDIPVDSCSFLNKLWKRQLNNKSIQLSESDKEILKRGFYIEDEIPKGGILFLGLNPYNGKIGKKEDIIVDNEKKIYGTTYNLQEIKKNCISNEPHEDKKYWGILVDMAVKIICENRGIIYDKENKSEDVKKVEEELQFCHHDIFFVRTASPRIVQGLIERNKAFFKEQLRLTKTLIQIAEPKIIIMTNLLALSYIDEYLAFGVNDSNRIYGKKGPTYYSGARLKIGEKSVELAFADYSRLPDRVFKSFYWYLENICKHYNIEF